MTALNVKGFRGQVPRIADRLIGANFASHALNCKITAGRIDPLKGLALTHTSLAASITTMYRYRSGALDNWLIWPRVVDVVRSPTAQDSRGRLFYTGDGEPRMTTFADAIAGGGPYPAGFFTLGVYIPGAAPSLAVVGGAAPVETRAYVYTFKTQYGEESAPSLPVVVSGNISGSWNLSALETAPPNSGTISAAATVATGVVEVTLDTVRGLAVNEEITFAGVVGMTDLNRTFTITTVDTATNKVRVDLATVQTYAAGADTWARRAPHNTAGMTKVIYRTVGTNTDYQRVAEIAAATTTYADTIAATALGEAIPTLDSFTPPKNGHSMVALANGALAMLAGNEVCLSEQYKPYSWPLANRYAFSGVGVALCAAGNSVIVLTDSFPVVATATVPEAASLARLPTYAPCISKRGVVDIGGGCLYPSHDGLYLTTPGDSKNITDALYRYDEWQDRRPASFKAAFFDQRYYAMHDGGAGQTARILVLDLADPDSVTEVDERVDTLYANPVDGLLYAGKGNKIFQWDGDDANRYLSFWKSREYQLGAPVNFGWAQVHAQYVDIVPISTAARDANIALLTSAENIEGAMGSISAAGLWPLGATNLQDGAQQTANRVQFSLIKDSSIVFSKDLSSSKPFRLPAGIKSEIYAMQISTSLPVFSMTVAQTAQELAQATV
jgi:hypothetical protein